MDKIYIGLYHLFGGLSIFEKLFSAVFEGVRKIPYSHDDRMRGIRSMIVYGYVCCVELEKVSLPL